ncbi:hypothetical protein Vadar_004064 [Vaccinium darrowii]|uniref:Uncharacterized protein n=1 Tax=Vaccinium darrowii TaxID=229202 RepID=A0ACB7XFP8_9ERIC|nr:hypothetical protein Vadar_004064 [Vaccinium darrowii]
MYDSFQEFGLQCFDGYKIGEMQCREKIRTKGLALSPAFQELHSVLGLVCQIHELPLAMTWIPCSACNGLLQGPLWSKDGFFTGVEFSAHTDSPLNDFLKIGKCRHLRKGWVAGRALSSLNMLYFPDITKLSVDEYPLVPYARKCKFSGWFIVCLQSSNTGDDIYVLEFFWSTSSKETENILERLSKILGTMEENLENFQFASGLKLGYLSSVEVIDFQNDQKFFSIHGIQAARDFFFQLGSILS